MKKRTKIISALFVLMALVVLPHLAVLKHGTGKQVSELSENYFRDSNGIYFLPRNNSFLDVKKYVEGADLETFEVFGQEYAKDNRNVYREAKKIEVTNLDSLMQVVADKEKRAKDNAETTGNIDAGMELFIYGPGFLISLIIFLFFILIRRNKFKRLPASVREDPKQKKFFIGKTLTWFPAVLWPHFTTVAIILSIILADVNLLVGIIVFTEFIIYPIFLIAAADFGEIVFRKTDRLWLAFLTQFAGLVVIGGYYLFLLWLVFW